MEMPGHDSRKLSQKEVTPRVLADASHEAIATAASWGGRGAFLEPVLVFQTLGELREAAPHQGPQVAVARIVNLRPSFIFSFVRRQ